MFSTYREVAETIRQYALPIKWIDRDKGQLKDPDQFHTIITPGVLLHFGEVDWINTGAGNQDGWTILRASLVMLTPASTFQPESDPLHDYTDSEALTESLISALEKSCYIHQMRASKDYYTGIYYVCEFTFDVKVRRTNPVLSTAKPVPTIIEKLKLPV